MSKNNKYNQKVEVITSADRLTQVHKAKINGWIQQSSILNNNKLFLNQSLQQI